jgi:hypothetical protein
MGYGKKTNALLPFPDVMMLGVSKSSSQPTTASSNHHPNRQQLHQTIKSSQPVHF